MKKIILSLLTVAATINAFGWELDLGLNAGLRVGVNISNITAVGDDSKSYEKGAKQLGFNVGAFYDWEIVECFYIQPGVSYTTRGSDFSGEDLSSEWNIGYIQVPLLASYRLDFGDNLKFALNCGPTLGYAIVGNNVYESYDANNKVELSESLFEEGSNFNRFELGVNIGLSYFIKNHYINLSWERGLSSIYDFDGSDCKLKNNNIALTVGYTF